MKIKDISFENAMKFFMASILLYSVIGGLCFQAYYRQAIPYIDSRILQANTILSCASYILFQKMWKKHGTFLYRFFPHLIFGTDVLMLGTFLIAFYFNAIGNYYVVYLIVGELIGGNISLAWSKYKAFTLSGKVRERYDNDCNKWNSIGNVIGASLGIILNTGSWNFWILVGIMSAGNFIDDLSYYTLWKLSYEEVIEKSKEKDSKKKK